MIVNDKPKSTNVVYHQPLISRPDREVLNNHKSAVVWFTGLSASGKSSVAHAVVPELYQTLPPRKSW
jgi:adenylylsulfate kinase